MGLRRLGQRDHLDRIRCRWVKRRLSSFSIELPVRLPAIVLVPKMSSVVRTSSGSGATPTTTSRPRGASPGTSGDIEAPLAAVAITAAAPPRSHRARRVGWRRCRCTPQRPSCGGETGLVAAAPDPDDAVPERRRVLDAEVAESADALDGDLRARSRVDLQERAVHRETGAQQPARVGCVQQSLGAAHGGGTLAAVGGQCAHHRVG